MRDESQPTRGQIEPNIKFQKIQSSEFFEFSNVQSHLTWAKSHLMSKKNISPGVEKMSKNVDEKIVFKPI